VKSSAVPTRTLFAPIISLVIFGMAIWNCPSRLVAQSVVPDDVKHDTAGQLIKKGQSLHMDVDLALVNVTVTDPHDRLVTGLEPDNFRIFENNIEEEILFFSSEDVPISVGVIFDLSGSMTNKVGKAKEAALQFFKTANPQDEFFLVSFNERAELISTFTTSVEDLQSSLLSSSPKGRTALLDGIYLGLSEMRTARNAKRLCSSYLTGEITIVDTLRAISSGWCERQIPSCTQSAFLTRLVTARGRLRNSMGPLC
jgi:hypothetical protein